MSSSKQQTPQINSEIKSWEQLQKGQEGDDCALTGFLYKAPDGSWILSPNPQLKSCCLGRVEKEPSQIALSRDYSSFSLAKPLCVQGKLHTSSQGSLTLQEIEAIQKGSFPLWTAGALLLGLGFCAFKLKRLLLP